LPSDIVITVPRLIIPLYELPFATGLVDRVFLKTTPHSLTMDEALKLTPGGNAYQPGPSSEFFVDTRIRF